MLPAMTDRMPPVAFELLLRSKGSGRTPTSRNLDQFRADPEAAERVRRWLHAHGVTAHSTEFTVAGAAPRKIFESLFGVRLRPNKAKTRLGDWSVEGHVRIPEEIADLVENVTLSVTPELF